MIASALRLKRADCKALEIKDAYSLHRIVYSLFPEQDGQTRDFLYADKGGDWNCRQILILSERRPETPEFGEIESKEIPDSFLRWDNYGFEVTVNPTQRNGPFKKTTPIKGRENLHNWFIQKAPALGFEVEPNSLQVSKIGVVSFDRDKSIKQTHQKAPALGFEVEPNSLQVSKIGVVSFDRDKSIKQTHGTATFIGKLKVINREAFINSFKHGIGRARGFGFGLLQIVPIQKL